MTEVCLFVCLSQVWGFVCLGVRLSWVYGLVRFPSMAWANCPLRLCDQGLAGRGPRQSFRARIVMRGAQTVTRQFGNRQYLIRYWAA